MRADMKQVLIERPRSGMRLKHKRTNKPRTTDWDGEDFTVERIAPRPPRTKHFDDLLGPLRKFLRSQVGRPWDKVYSEICAGIDSRSVTGRHLLDHVDSEVATNCELDAKGKPHYRPDHYWRDRELTGLYVHPRTRLLCFRAPKSTRQWRLEQAKKRAQETAHYRDLGNGEFLVKRTGVWCWVQTRRVDWWLEPSQRKRDQRVDLKLDRAEYTIVRVRQLNWKELRVHGLVNDPCDQHVSE